MQPYEVICAPYTVYASTVGTPFPFVNAAPSTSWTQIGTSGNKNYADAGVTVTHSQTVSTFVPAGSTTTRKAWRSAEGLSVAFQLADLSPAQYALMLDNVSVVTQAPTTAQGGDQHFEVMRGVQVQQYALLVRGLSPVNEAYTAQYEIAASFQTGNPAPVYSKAGPAMLAVEFDAYELNPGSLATWRAQTSPHS